MDGAADRALMPTRSVSASALVRHVGENGLAIAVACGFGAALVAASSRLISTDGWLALVAGRLIAERGLPSENTLTIIGNGRAWVDQQWLAQLTIYGLERAGGLRLVLLAHVALLLAGFAGAVILGRRRGGSPAAVGIVAGVALVPFAVTTYSLRTQSLVYPLFVALVAIMTAPGRLHARHLVGIGALLVLWANLHGSVLVAAALVALRGLVELRASPRGRSATGWSLAIVPWALVFASPYAGSLPAYYADTALNGSFAHYLAQWQPTSLSATSAPLFLLVLGSVWVVGRAGGAYDRYEKLAGGMLLVLALLAVRHWAWFSLFALALLPRGMTRIRREQPSPGVVRMNFALAAGAAALFAVVAASTAAKPQSWFERSFPEAGAAAVAGFAQRHPEARIYATERYADWLLWKLPWLEGRLAYDARFELLEREELQRIALFRASPVFLAETLRSYDLLVLDRGTEYRVIDAWQPSMRTIYTSPGLVVAAKREETRS